MYDNNDIIDFEKLRSDLINYFGTAMSNGFPIAIIDLVDVERKTPRDLIDIAIKNGFNLEDYKLKNNTNKYR